MAKNKVRENGLSVRLRESTWKLLEDDMKRLGLTSMNQAVQRRLDQSVANESMKVVAELAAQQTALQHTEIIIEHIHKLAGDFAAALDKLSVERDHDRRVVDLHEMLIRQLSQKEKEANDQA
jgi:hypothetical protein